MTGLLKIALKLLANDRGKFLTLVIGITFATFLMMQMTSVFAGLMRRTSANIINIGARIWVMDPFVNAERDNIPLPEYVLDSVRSIKGVKYSAPIYIGSAMAKLADGRFQSVAIIGLDEATLTGSPHLAKGSIESLYNEDSYILVKDADHIKLGRLDLGDEIEVNQRRAVITGFADVSSGGLFGIPTLYTTYSRAIQDLPASRNTCSYVLVEPKSKSDIAHIQSEVDKLGYKALTKEQFIKLNADFYKYKTGMGTNILIMTLISFIVGLSIAGQTFYSFVNENLEKFGALRAIGARRVELVKMILFQAATSGFLGYGLGVLLSSGVIAAAKWRLPAYASIVTLHNLVYSFLAVIVIVAFSSYIGIRRVINADPYNVFKG